MSLLARSSLRYLLLHPAQLALTVLGIGLGVAVVVAMDLAIESARRSLSLSTRGLAGAATHHVTGGPAGVPDEAFRVVRVEARIRSSAPIVEGHATSRLLPGRALRVLGVDPLSERPFRPFLARGSGSGDASALLTGPAVLPSAAAARAAGVAPGDTLPLEAAGGVHPGVVAGVLEGEDALSREGLADLVVADVGTAQRLLGMEGRLTRIELALPEGSEGAAALARLEAALPAGTRVRTAGARADDLAAMTAAFDLNLRALSLLALVFGAFLVYNAVSFSVVQRRELLGRLRALGVTPGRVFVQVLGEAAALGVVGGVLGLLAGVILGRGLVRLVVRTINDLYFALSVEGLALPPGVLVKGALLGTGAALLGALVPAREAATTPPRATLARSELEERWRRLAPRAAVAGVGLAGAGALALLLSVRSLAASFAGLFAVVLGAALLVPLALVLLLSALAPFAGHAFGLLGRLSVRGVLAGLSRSAPAVASLVVAVSVTVALGVMIASFRGTLERWLARTLQADVYVSAPLRVGARAMGALDPEVVGRMVSAPGVAGASRYRSVELSTAYGETRVTAIDLHPRGESALDLLEGRPESALAVFRGDEGVLVSEAFAWRHGLGVGSSVRLPTARGERALPVRGVFYDYGSDRGLVMMGLSTYRSLWPDTALTSLGLFLEPGLDASAAAESLRALAPGDAPVAVRSNRTLREASLAVFDRTFTITGVLRALAFLVAFAGIVGALMALQLERARELAVLRATGLTPGELWGLVVAQTGLMGLSAGLLSAPLGVLLAVLMVEVVNRRSFGWTIQLEVGPGVLLQGVALALTGALLAGLYPAWRMARTGPAEALREE